MENLDELHMYEFRAKAVNSIGESDPSIPLTVVIQDDEGLYFLGMFALPKQDILPTFLMYFTICCLKYFLLQLPQLCTC